MSFAIRSVFVFGSHCRFVIIVVVFVDSMFVVLERSLARGHRFRPPAASLEPSHPRARLGGE